MLKAYVKVNLMSLIVIQVGVRARLSTKPNIVQFLYKRFDPFSC